MDKPDFDELKCLAERDPDAFEKLRSELVEDLIRNSSPNNQRRLRGLQFSTDARRRLASNPMKALLDIQAMMHVSLYQLSQALQALSEQSTPEKVRAPQVDNVVPFSRGASSSRAGIVEHHANR